MRTDRKSSAATSILQIFDQLLGGFELRARRLLPVEIAHQANAEADVVHIIAVNVTAAGLPNPAVPDFDLAIACRRPISDHEVVSQAVPHPAHAPMIIIEDARTALPSAAVVHDDKFPARALHRRATDGLDICRRKVTIVGRSP